MSHISACKWLLGDGVIKSVGKKPRSFIIIGNFGWKNVATIQSSVNFRSRGSLSHLIFDSSFTFFFHHPGLNLKSFFFLPFLSAFPISFSFSCFSHMLNNFCFHGLPANFLYFPSLSKPVHWVKKLPTLSVLVFFNFILLLFMLPFLFLPSLKKHTLKQMLIIFLFV